MASAVDPSRAVCVETGVHGLECLHPKNVRPGTDNPGSVFRAGPQYSGIRKIFRLGDDPGQGRFRHEDCREDIKTDPEKVMDLVMGGGDTSPAAQDFLFC